MPKIRKKKRPVKKPHDFDKVDEAILLYVQGYNRSAIARAIGMSIDTIHAWEASEWWAPRIATAREEQFHELASKALQCLIDNVDKDPELALKVAERLWPKLSPAAQKVELDQTLSVKGEVITYVPENGRKREVIDISRPAPLPPGKDASE